MRADSRRQDFGALAPGIDIAWATAMKLCLACVVALTGALVASAAWADENGEEPLETCPPGAFCEEVEVGEPEATEAAPAPSEVPTSEVPTSEVPGSEVVVAAPEPSPPPAAAPTWAPPGTSYAPSVSDPGPEKMAYREGEPVPPGYGVKRRRRPALVATGVSMFASAFIASTIAGTAGLLDECDAFEPCNRAGYLPLFIPVIGPSITMVTAEPRDTGAYAALFASGAVQTAGMIMWIVGSASRDLELVRLSPVAVAPVVGPSAQGVAVQGAF